MNKVADFFAQLFFPARGRFGRTLWREQTGLFRKFNLSLAEVIHLPEQSCVKDNLGSKLERFKAFESFGEGVAANHHAVVFQHDTIRPRF